MGATTFEERLLPLLVEDLVARSSESRGLRPRRAPARAAVALLAAAVVVAVALVTGGSSDGTITVTVTSASMLPTLTPGEVVTVDTGAYSSQLPARGDIVAFRVEDESGNIFLKRVIGLPGDFVEEVDGVVSVNGQALDEPYADLDHRDGSWTVEPGRVFVMGDSRANSSDSRFTEEWGLGQVPITSLIGRVIVGPVSGAPDIPPGPAATAPGPAAS
jgi:signal peptidase I